jgi:hypothetical protein
MSGYTITLTDSEYDALKAKIARLEAALNEELRVLEDYEAGSTHFEDCWKIHPRCAAVRRMTMALNGSSVETETKS